MNYQPITLAIADDHTLFRKGVIEILKGYQEITVLYDAGTGVELLEEVEKQQPDLVLLDLEMPEMDGVATARFLISKYPKIKILIISMYEEVQLVEKLIKEGVHGYLLKNAEPDEMRNAIQRIMQGEKHYYQS